MTTKNFDAPAFFSNGDPIKKLNSEEQGTFKYFILFALSASYESDRSLPAAELYKRGKLADMVDAGGDLDLDSTQITMIKDFIAKAWSVRIITAVHDMIERDYIPKGA
jgi:hypothetical protein